MKNIIKILVVIIMVFIQSCEKDNGCNDVLCFTPPATFEFELVDKSTGENLFTNGTYIPSDIKIIDLENNNRIFFSFTDENNSNLIQINTIGWETEIKNYLFQTSTKDIFELFVNAERLSEDCCSFTRFNEVRIENSEFELNQSTGIYKILVD